MSRFLCLLAVIFSFNLIAIEKTANELQWEGGPFRLYFDTGLDRFKSKSENLSSKKWHWDYDLGICYTRPTELYLELLYKWNGGPLKSTGGLQAYDHSTDFAFRLGYMAEYGANGQFTVTPYTGIGYQKKNLSVSTLDGGAPVSSLQTRDNNWYLPVGVFANWFFHPKFDIGIQAEAQLAFRHRFEMSAVNDNTATNGAPTPVGDPNAGARIRIKDNGKGQVNWLVSLPLTWQFRPHWDLKISPFFTYQQNEPKSNMVATPATNPLNFSNGGPTTGIGGLTNNGTDNVTGNTLYDSKLKNTALGVTIGIGLRF